MRTLPSRRHICVVLYVFNIFLCGLPFVAAGEGDAEPQEAPGADIDVSSARPPECRKCRNSGSILCPMCKGRGTSIWAQVECPRCHGEKFFDCTACDEEGKENCPKCKKRKVDGESIYAMVNPAWIDWERRFGETGRRSHHPDRSRIPKRDWPKEPQKYVPCTNCDATGRSVCERCGGDKKTECPRCDAKGTVRGRGTCPTCHGMERVPCPECSTMEGMENIPAFHALDELLEKKLLTPKDYFKRRRQLVAEERYRQQMLAERTNDGAAETQPGESTPAGNQNALAELSVLQKAFATRALKIDGYRERVRELGLSEKAVLQAEKEIARENERVKAWVELKEKFRNGDMDMHAFEKAAAEL